MTVASTNDIHNIDVDQLREKHSDFLDKCQNLSVKLDADEHLEKTKIYAKIDYIVGMMITVGAIDKMMSANDLNGDDTVMVRNLVKNGYYSSIRLFTNGQSIVVSANNNDQLDILLESNIGHGRRYFVHDIDNKDFDWSQFTEDLLGYIHTVIYHSKEARLMSIFTGTGKE